MKHDTSDTVTNKLQLIFGTYAQLPKKKKKFFFLQLFLNCRLEETLIKHNYILHPEHLNL